MILQEILDKTIRFFKDKNLDSPRLDAELLLARAMDFRRIDLYLKFDQPMGEAELTKCRDFVRRRSQGEPVAYILGEKDFFGLTFQVDARVLIPRPETELLAEAAVEHLKKHKAISAEEIQILDLGCGSGCLGLSVLSNTPGARLTAVDLSKEALDVTKANAERLGLLYRCEFIQGDAAHVDLSKRTFDMVLANPPYIAKGDVRLQPEVAKFEPNMALFADDDGFACIKTWSEHSLPLMKEKSWIGFEFGAGQEDMALAHFRSLGLEDVQIIKDLADLPRHVVGKKGF